MEREERIMKDSKSCIMTWEEFLVPRGRWGREPPLAERIDATGDCWEWSGGHDRDGYSIDLRHRGRRYKVHRFMWEALVGPIPEGMQIHHQCENTGCINPDHLMVVTPKENTNLSHSANSNKTHCLQGHPYSGKNLRNPPSSGRRCKTCENQKARKRYART